MVVIQLVCDVVFVMIYAVCLLWFVVFAVALMLDLGLLLKFIYWFGGALISDCLLLICVAVLY